MSHKIEELEEITITGLDFVLLTMNLTVEIVTALSATSKEAEQRLISVANQLQSFARDAPDKRLGFVLGQLASALMATEFGPNG